MKLCLAGTYAKKKILQTNLAEVRFVLESYYYVQPWQAEQIGGIEHFMLDSGAFTFLNSKRHIDIDEYVEGYIDFINKYDVQYFFELDIDSIVGYDEVKKIRRKIERKTKKRCIPVWHKSRGIREFRNLCKKYDYIAIGGIVTKEISPVEYFLFNAFCDFAHSEDCKIHGLGFTPVDLKEYKFDSVDSTSWIAGGRFGKLYEFANGRMYSSQARKRMHYLEYDKHNLKQFLMFQDFLC